MPKSKSQKVTELESWTLRWEIQGNGYGDCVVKYKSFIDEKDAMEFKKQLKSSADFLGTWVDVKINKN